jgi:hypothetical protein
VYTHSLPLSAASCKRNAGDVTSPAAILKRVKQLAAQLKK